MLLILTRTARSVTAIGLSGVATVMRTTADLVAGVSSVVRPDNRPQRAAAPVTMAERPGTATIPRRPKTAAEPNAPKTTQTEALAGTEPETTETVAESPAAERPEDEPTVATSTAQGSVTAEDIAETFEQRGRVSEPPQVAVPDVTHVAVAPTHIAEVAGGTIAEVTQAIEQLSTDELRQLLEHETANKRRRRVLDAVETALTP